MLDNEIQCVIHKNRSTKKARGIDLIESKFLEELMKETITLLIVICNTMLPYLFENCTNSVNPYTRGITRGNDSIWVNKPFANRLKSSIGEIKLFPMHQFCSRQQYVIIEQTHRISTKIRGDLDDKKCYPVVFLDVSHAFDKN